MKHFKSRVPVLLAALLLCFCCLEMGEQRQTIRTVPRAESGPRGFQRVLSSWEGKVSGTLVADDFFVIAREDPSEIMILDIESGDVRATLTDVGEPVAAMAISSDRRILATTDESGEEIRLWDLSTSEVRKSLKPPNPVTSLAFGFQDAVLAAGGKDGEITLLDLSSDRALRSLSIPNEKIEGLLKEPPGRIRNIAVCPSDRFVAALENNGMLLVWDLSDNDRADIHLIPPHRLWSMAFSEDGRYLLAAGGSYSVSITLSDGDADIRISNLGGVLFLRDMSDGRTFASSTKQRVFDNAFFSSDGHSVICHASEPPAKNGMTTVLVIYPLECLLEENLKTEVFRRSLGRGPFNRISVFSPRKSIFGLLHDRTLYFWTIQ